MSGSFQPMACVMVAVNCHISGVDVQEALDFPTALPKDGAVLVESTISPRILHGPCEGDHRSVPAREPLGSRQAIVIHHARGLLRGGSDHRKDGATLSY
jgi:gamma-glutamyltranspeptidase/glutathione hydrolase